ncbi:splicing factor 3B subunit 1-like [Dorcoceras hygrometricum]|uniref:Splicing factor 3B subunit 1-like n=1 Tax=Dorcoceras hygrometricum TaxID=472368 RepID=A0A2Z7CXS2_9LAMI|nr:splicing factor 3B subunit 1-like [Dorcoceras hygrometricum]
MASALINNTIQFYFASILGWNTRGWSLCSKPCWHMASVGFWDVHRPYTKPLWWSSSKMLQSGMAWLIWFLKQGCFRYDGKLLSTSCKKREMAFEFRLLNAILAKSVIVKVGSFDAMTHERFLMMSAIYGSVPINWGRLLFKIFKDMIAVNDEDDNIDGAENESARKMASFTASKQFLKEPLRSGEDDDMSGSKQPGKIIEPTAVEQDKEIEPVATVELSLAKSVATMIDSEDTEPLSKTLQTQMRIHGLKWERICSSRLFEGAHRDRGAVIARSNMNKRSLCWIRTKTLVDGSWLIQESNDFWIRLPKPVLSLEWQIPAQWQFGDTLAPISEFFMLLRKQWADLIPSYSSSSSSTSKPDPISPNVVSAPPGYMISPNPSISTESCIFFTTDDTPLGVDQILMPSIVPHAPDFAESLEQLWSSVTQLSFKQMRNTRSIGDFKNELLSKIDNIEKAAAETPTQQDQVFRDLLKVSNRKYSFRELPCLLNCLNLRKEFGHIVPSGGDAKKGKSGSSRGPQPPPDDRGRHGSGNEGSRPGGSRSELSRKRGGGGSQRRDWRYWIGGN